MCVWWWCSARNKHFAENEHTDSIFGHLWRRHGLTKYRSTVFKAYTRCIEHANFSKNPAQEKNTTLERERERNGHFAVSCSVCATESHSTHPKRIHYKLSLFSWERLFFYRVFSHHFLPSLLLFTSHFRWHFFTPNTFHRFCWLFTLKQIACSSTQPTIW